MSNTKSRPVLIFTIGVILGLLAFGLIQYSVHRAESHPKRTFSSFDPPIGPAGQICFNTNMLKLEAADLTKVLDLYQEVSGRTVIRNTRLSDVKITLHNALPLNRVEALQLLDTALAENGVVMIVSGDLAVKAVPAQSVASESPPEIEMPSEDLPDSSSYMMWVAPLRKANPDQVTKLMGLFAAMPSSVIYVPSGNILILRDFSSNIRRMLHLLDEAQRPDFNFNLFSSQNPPPPRSGSAGSTGPPGPARNRGSPPSSPGDVQVIGAPPPRRPTLSSPALPGGIVTPAPPRNDTNGPSSGTNH